MGLFERYLSIWVALAILAGVALGVWIPPLFESIAAMQWASVNLVIAPLIWLMVYPMMLKVSPDCLSDVRRSPRGIVLTLVVNWLIKPFTMAAIAVFFFRFVVGDAVPEADAQEYIAGMILLGVAPCTAMGVVWSQLVDGDANYTLVQVSVNDLIMVFAFAPIAGLLLGVTDLEVPWNTLIFAVLAFVVVPLAAGIMTQRVLVAERIEKLGAQLKPLSIVGLLLTVVLLFGFQAETILARPGRVLLIAIPLLIQSVGIFAIAYAAARWLKLPHDVAAPAALIGTSNFFELAVAVAVSLFGLSSGAALATVVGVLIEVPVMLALVGFSRRTRHWFAASSSRASVG